MNVYFVEDIGNCPGRVWCVFALREDAESFKRSVSRERNTKCKVIPRKLFYGQPPVCGFNK